MGLETPPCIGGHMPDGATVVIPSKASYLRVVTLADGETIHNAFFDRGFREDGT
jgi:hypothetical protein